MQPTATLAQMTTAFCSVVIAATALIFTIHTWSDSRNAQLVQIGVGILEIDPTKEAQSSGAREWALDLIEANSGGVKFSKPARDQLLNGRLVTWNIGSPGIPGGNSGPLSNAGSSGSLCDRLYSVLERTILSDDDERRAALADYKMNKCVVLYNREDGSPVFGMREH
jgi:hypothetical protein